MYQNLNYEKRNRSIPEGRGPDYYLSALTQIDGNLKLPSIPEYATNNAHMFYLVCGSLKDRTNLIEQMKNQKILAVFHYLSLHSSQFYKDKHDGRVLPNCDKFANCLIRLPLYFELSTEEINAIVSVISKIK